MGNPIKAESMINKNTYANKSPSDVFLSLAESFQLPAEHSVCSVQTEQTALPLPHTVCFPAFPNGARDYLGSYRRIQKDLAILPGINIVAAKRFSLLPCLRFILTRICYLEGHLGLLYLRYLLLPEDITFRPED